MSDNRRLVVKVWLAVVAAAISFSSTSADEHTKQLLDQIGITRGICVLLGDPTGEKAIELAKDSELLVYLQLPQGQDVERARRAADETGYLGRRIYIDKGELTRLHLADNLADAVIAVGKAVDNVVDAEVLRVLRPQGKALLGRREIIKPVPEGLDDWSHPYHGPDNNPQSKDQIIRAPYLTQFLADPQYGPSPQVTVASAGRVFKAFGNVAWHKREEQFLNKLVAFNGYNGTILWQRDLPPGVLLHRNTMIATPQILYVGDDESCKLIDTATGKLIDEIIPPLEVAGGTFWKWMGLQDGVLYALVGEQEYKDEVKKWNRKQHGWPWTGVSKGYDKPKHTWGYGKNVLAIDPKNKQVIWHHHEDEAIDSRAMCMKNGRIYVFRFGSFLACLDAKTGKERWRKTKGENPEIFESMGKYLNRQGWQTNWRTVVYLKCSDKALYFAGPQVGKLLAVSVEDGSILWENPYSNFQLVLRDDGLYGFSGPWGHNASKKFDPLTGEVLAAFDTGRRACTRPTGAIDAIFYRAMGGTIRFDLASAKPHWISPMRPQCHEGVTIANGYLYWWPWACDCQLTLLGVTCLGPAGDFNFTSRAIEAERLERFSADPAKVAPLPVSSVDWPTFRAGNNCTAITTAVVSKTGDVIWRHLPEDGKRNVTPTAPVTAGGMIFVGDDTGVVHALDTKTGDVRWKAYTGGAIRFPPTVWNGRALVGSGDGWVYAYEAQTGRLIWRFRAAPVERKIPVYGSLLSTWPAASGILVEDGIAYVAAGIANYDGTYVYALDAETGKIKWQNNTSGHLYPEARTGVGVQGHQLLYDGKLYLAGGNAVSPAVYDIRDGKCLNDPEQLKNCESAYPRGWELFLVGEKVVTCGRPFYVNPEWVVYDRTVTNKMLHVPNGNRDITWENNRHIKCFAPIDRKLLSKCIKAPRTEDVRHVIPIWGKLDIPDKPLWSYDAEGSVALAVCKNAVVVATENKPEIVALNIADGQPLWHKPLPADPVPWGLAVDRDGRTVVTLKGGKVVCLR